MTYTPCLLKLLREVSGNAALPGDLYQDTSDRITLIAIPNGRPLGVITGAAEYERGAPGGFRYSPEIDPYHLSLGYSPKRVDGPPGSRGPPHTGQDRSRGSSGFSGGPPRERGGRGPNSGGTGQAKRRQRGPHPNQRR